MKDQTVLVRTIYAHHFPYSETRGSKREITNHVCVPCGVRVVLHAHPPRVTPNDRRFGEIKTT